MHKDPRYDRLETLGTKPDKGRLIDRFSLIQKILLYVNTIVLIVLLQLLTIISSIDDLNYPEKTQTYYIVNAPYVFSACWRVRLTLQLSCKSLEDQ